jgi:uncharacterized membrane protein YfcA
VSAALVAALAGVAFAAFATEAMLGFAGTVLAVSLGAQLVPLDLLLPAFVPINLALSLSIAVADRARILWRQLAVELAPPVGVGAAFGLVLFRLPWRLHLQLCFGLFVVALAGLELWRMRRPAAAPSRWTGRALLCAGGLAHGLFGAGGPMIVYVLRQRLADKAAFRATLAVAWLTLNSLLVANYAAMQLYRRELAAPMIAMAAVVAPAFVAGNRLHRAIEPALFHRVVVLLLVAAGALLAVRTAIALAA